MDEVAPRSHRIRHVLDRSEVHGVSDQVQCQSVRPTVLLCQWYLDVCLRCVAIPEQDHIGHTLCRTQHLVHIIYSILPTQPSEQRQQCQRSDRRRIRQRRSHRCIYQCTHTPRSALHGNVGVRHRTSEALHVAVTTPHTRVTCECTCVVR